eukprot:2015338-Prymnesium_polylepis.1
MAVTSSSSRIRASLCAWSAQKPGSSCTTRRSPMRSSTRFTRHSIGRFSSSRCRSYSSLAPWLRGGHSGRGHSGRWRDARRVRPTAARAAMAASTAIVGMVWPMGSI